MTKERRQCETLIYEYFDAVDPSKENSSYYKERFSKMSDEEFTKYFKLEYPLILQVTPFKLEPTIDDANNGLKVLKVPLLEEVFLNYFYKNKDGNPIESLECIVGYMPHKKMKQFITKKNSMSTNISMRDMSGLLIADDKNSITSDREMEALAINQLNNTMEELSKPRADSMNAKSQMYNTISTLGSVKLSDIENTPDDSLAKNMINAYMIGSQLYTNIIDDDYFLPITLKNRNNKIERK